MAGRVSFEVTPDGLDERLLRREAREVITNVTCDAGAPASTSARRLGRPANTVRTSSRSWLST
jgi:hypothetical protein